MKETEDGKETGMGEGARIEKKRELKKNRG